MNGLKCPLYDEYNACETHSDCVFNNDAGCAVQMAMIACTDNAKVLSQILSLLNDIRQKLDFITTRLP